MGFITLNFKHIYNYSSVVKKGDIIQLTLYSDFIYLLNSWGAKQRNYLWKIQKKLKKPRLEINKKKTQPTYSPRWFFNINNYGEPIYSYFEVDYLTLSVIVIKLPNYFNFQSRFFNPLMFKLMNYPN